MIDARIVARGLESGRFAGPLTRAIARVVSPLQLRARLVSAPEHVRMICVGGATLGGSGKSRVANGIASALPEAVLIGHGYRAGDRRARFVRPNETVDSAGDEALVAARAGLRVVIGPTRQAAIDFAARHSELLVLDGPLAVTHRRSASVLAVNEELPWGSGAVFPAGDLRAPADALERMADFVVRVPAAIELPADVERPFGLFTALARPDRLIRELRPDVVVSAPDHAGFRPRKLAARLSNGRVTTWLATEKCATHLTSLADRPGGDVKFPYRVLRDTYMARLDRVFVRRIVSSIDCERAGREDTRNDHRPKTGRRAGGRCAAEQ